MRYTLKEVEQKANGFLNNNIKQDKEYFLQEIEKNKAKITELNEAKKGLKSLLNVEWGIDFIEIEGKKDFKIEIIKKDFNKYALIPLHLLEKAVFSL